VVPDRAELAVSFERLRTRMHHLVRTRVDHWRRVVKLLARSGALQEPGRVVAERAQRLDDWEQRLRESVRRQLQVSRERTAGARRCLELSRPDRIVAQWRERVSLLRQRLAANPPRYLAELRHHVKSLTSMLRSLGPESVLSRGYSLTADSQGNVVTSVQQVKTGETLVTRLADGSLQSRIEEIRREF
jgi:exodeoxyribonuclease VII large subunit